MIDACCMRHDRCLQAGIHPCYCDYEFMHCLYPYLSLPTPEGRHARIMYRVIQLRTKFRC